MPDKSIIDDGATQVGIAWLIKELFAFLTKWRKAEKESASDSDSGWKEFCREQFSDIKNEVSSLRQRLEILDDKIQDMKIEHRKCGGKD